jgi:hypothetical protein
VPLTRRFTGIAVYLTNGFPIPPMDAGVTNHVWKIDESVALLVQHGANSLWY